MQWFVMFSKLRDPLKVTLNVFRRFMLFGPSSFPGQMLASLHILTHNVKECLFTRFTAQTLGNQIQKSI